MNLICTIAAKIFVRSANLVEIDINKLQNVKATLSMHYGTISFGVSILGLQTLVDFCIKVSRFEENFEWNIAEQTKIGPFFDK